MRCREPGQVAQQAHEPLLPQNAAVSAWDGLVLALLMDCVGLAVLGRGVAILTP